MKNILEMTREELIIRIMDLEAYEEENSRLKKEMSDMAWARDGDRMGGGTGYQREYDEWGNQR
tara:strand:- start:819 stop:1007 length:189 start_codon:yes stop_codon:yes gene_type:complete